MMKNKNLFKTYQKRIIAVTLAIFIIFPLLVVSGEKADISVGFSDTGVLLGASIDDNNKILDTNIELSDTHVINSGVLLGTSVDDNDDETLDTSLGLSQEESEAKFPQQPLTLEYAMAAVTALDMATPVTGYDEIVEAVNNLTINAVRLEADFAIENTVEIDRNFTVYGNNHKLTSGPDINMFHVLGGIPKAVTFNNVDFIGASGSRAILSTADKVTLTIADSQFSGFNRLELESQEEMSEMLGGAVFLAGGYHYFYGNTFSDNKAMTGGAVAAFESIKVIMEGNTFHSNGDRFATDMGGAIVLMDVFEVSSSGDSFVNNQAANGGTMYISDGMVTSHTSIKDVTISGSNATSNGGAIYIIAESDDLSTLEIIGGEITSNTAKRGGAVYVKGNSMENLVFSINGTTFAQNTAVDFGGAIDMHPVDMNIENAIFSENKASRGGAIALITPDGAQRYLSVSGTTFIANSASDYGGGVYADNYSYKTDIKFNDSVFEGNDAGFSGGGLFMGMDTNIYVSGGRFFNNTASDNGGAISAAIPSMMHYQQPGDRENLYINSTAFDGNMAGTTPQWLIKTLEPELARLQDEGTNVKNLVSLSKPFDVRFNYIYNNYDVSFFGSHKVSGLLEHKLSNATPFPDDTFQMNLYSTQQANDEGDQRSPQLDARDNRTEEMENYFVIGQIYVLSWSPDFEGYVAEKVTIDFGAGNNLELTPQENESGQMQVSFLVPSEAIKTDIIWNSRYVGFNMPVEVKLIPGNAPHDPTKPFYVTISRDSNGTVLFEGVVEPDGGVVVHRFMPGQSYKVTEVITNPEYRLKEMTIEAAGGEMNQSSEDSYSFIARSEYTDKLLIITNELNAQVEILTVPNLEFGDLKIPGNQKVFNLKTDAVLEVQGVQGEDWHITAKVSNLVDTSKGNVISAHALKYVDSRGVHSMDIARRVWLERSNAETQIYRKNFKSLGEESIVMEVGPEISSGEYSGTVTWTLVLGI